MLSPEAPLANFPVLEQRQINLSWRRKPSASAQLRSTELTFEFPDREACQEQQLSCSSNNVSHTGDTVALPNYANAMCMYMTTYLTSMTGMTAC